MCRCSAPNNKPLPYPHFGCSPLLAGLRKSNFALQNAPWEGILASKMRLGAKKAPKKLDIFFLILTGAEKVPLETLKIELPPAREHDSAYFAKTRFRSPRSLVLAIRPAGGVRPASKGKTTLDAPPYSRGSGTAILRSQMPPGRGILASKKRLGRKKAKKAPRENSFFLAGRKKYPKMCPKPQKKRVKDGEISYIPLYRKNPPQEVA